MNIVAANKLRILSLVTELLIVASNISAQQANPQPSPTPTPKPAETKAIELNTILMRSTFELVGNGSIGTAFILGRPSTKVPTKAYYVLVTAAHVLEQMNGDEAALLLRKQDKDVYQKVLFKIQIREKGRPRWVKHPDADIAVMYVRLPDDIDIALLSTSFLATDEILTQFEIHPGDNLLCLGFPNGLAANEGGFPILRSGRIASFPIFPASKVKAFLFDFNIFSGNSGGPVYFVDYLRYYNGTFNAVVIQFIIGLVTQQVYESNSQGLDTGSKAKESLRLAVVIPAPLIREAIDLLPSLDQ